MPQTQCIASESTNWKNILLTSSRRWSFMRTESSSACTVLGHLRRLSGVAETVILKLSISKWIFLFYFIFLHLKDPREEKYGGFPQNVTALLFKVWVPLARSFLALGGIHCNFSSTQYIIGISSLSLPSISSSELTFPPPWRIC